MINRRSFIGGIAIASIAPLRLGRASDTTENSTEVLTASDRRLLRQQDRETLAEWACILNGWGWPALLPDPEPPTYIPNGRRSRIIECIHSRIGYEAVLWKHNQCVMTKEQFDDWSRMDRDEYKRKYPFNSRDFEVEREKRDAHKRAMYARHGARHLRYVEG